MLEKYYEFFAITLLLFGGHATSYLANELQNGKWLNLQERPAWLSHLRGVIKSPKPVTSHPILSEYSLKTSGPDSGGSSYPFQPNFFYNQWRSHYLPNNPFRSGLYPQETSQEPSLEDYGASTPSFDESSTDMPMKTPDFDQQTTELSSTTTSSAASVSAASEDLESTSMPQSPESSTDMPTTALDYDQKTSEKSPTSTVNVDSVPATSEDWQSNSTPQSSESSTIFIPKKVGEIIYPIAWPNGVVPYYVDDQNMTWYEKLLLQRAIEGFHRYTCVRFMPAERQSRPIAIISNQLKDKFGQVSKNAIQEYDVGIGCATEGIGMVQHELMHLLGFQHEEQRMDRDQYLEILAENICQEDSMKEFNITLPGYDVTSYPYDVESVMQDHDSKGACFRSKPTMRDRQGRQLGRQISLTAIDAQKINDVYQCGQILAPKPVPSGRPVNPCTFDVDWCGYTQYYKRSLYSTTDNDTFADDFDWVRTNQPVPGVGADYTVQQDHTGNGYHCIALAERHGYSDVAKIASPIFTSPGQQACLKFFWYMQERVHPVNSSFVHPLGQIDVILLIDGNEKIIKVIDYKTYKSEWTEALVDIPIETGTRFQVIFQANAGETHISDTAIDDIAIYSTSCSTEIDEKNLVQI